MLISHKFVSSSDMSTPVSNTLKAYLTEFGNDTDLSYSLNDGGPLLRGEYLVPDANGVVTAYTTNKTGYRITLKDVLGTVRFQQDVKASGDKEIAAIAASTAPSKTLTQSVAKGAINKGPVNAVAPVQSGTTTQSVTTGTWGGGVAPLTYSYRWLYADGTVVPTSGTTNSYVVQAGDTGLVIKAEVTATDARGSTGVFLTAGYTVP